MISPNNDLNGDLVINDGFVFSAWDEGEGNGVSLSDELGNLLGENLYINVHTLIFPSGELRGQIICESIPVGGELIPLDSTVLLLAGAQMTASWIVPVLVAGAGIGLVLLRRK